MKDKIIEFYFHLDVFIFLYSALLSPIEKYILQNGAFWWITVLIESLQISSIKNISETQT